MSMHRRASRTGDGLTSPLPLPALPPLPGASALIIDDRRYGAAKLSSTSVANGKVLTTLYDQRRKVRAIRLQLDAMRSNALIFGTRVPTAHASSALPLVRTTHRLDTHAFPRYLRVASSEDKRAVCGVCGE